MPASLERVGKGKEIKDWIKRNDMNFVPGSMA
jgi:hypothetical protein